MKRFSMLSIAAACLSLLTACKTQSALGPVGLQASAHGSSDEAKLYRVRTYDPWYDYSGSIFPYKDFYWYGRPPLYTVRDDGFQRFEPGIR
jgi:hypothetical protein